MINQINSLCGRLILWAFCIFCCLSCTFQCRWCLCWKCYLALLGLFALFSKKKVWFLNQYEKLTKKKISTINQTANIPMLRNLTQIHTKHANHFRLVVYLPWQWSCADLPCPAWRWQGGAKWQEGAPSSSSCCQTPGCPLFHSPPSLGMTPITAKCSKLFSFH